MPYPQTCLRCGYKWDAWLERPVKCASCRAKNWDRPPQTKYVPKKLRKESK